MAVQFEISALAETLAEGGTYTFTLTPLVALTAAVDIRWVIVPKGKIPITTNDFSAFNNDDTLVNFASGATAAKTITITPTDDSNPELSGEFEIQVYQVVTGSEDELIDSQDVTLTDDEAYTGVVASDLSGSPTVNNFFFGGSSPLIAEGFEKNDIYVMSRYQINDVGLDDTFGTNIIKFDFEAEISSARKTGRGDGDGELLLGTDSSSPTGTLTWASPAKWEYQIGNSDLLTWAQFLTALGPTTGTALTTPYTVDSLASDSATDGNEFASEFGGSDTGEVFSFGNDGELDGEGFGDDDIYIISRYQMGNAHLEDTFGTNIIKFDFKADISSARKTGRGDGDGELLLGTDSSSPTGTLTWASPAKWQYQIADGEVLSWAEFLTALGPTTGTALTTAYTVPGPPSDTPSAPAGVPDTGEHYFKWDAAKTGFGRFLVSDDSAADVSDATPGDVGGNDLVFLGAGVPSGRTIDFGAGTDVYVIQSGLNVDITINDQIHGVASATTQNLVRFDADLLTGVYEATTVPVLTGDVDTVVKINGTGSLSTSTFDITLQGAAQNYVYQIGDDGDVMTYTEFTAALDLI